jgi:hypothetical protein
MPYDEPDATDPMLLVGVELLADAGASLETARVFAEEFARMGFGEESLLDLFRNPFYAGAHQAYLALGEAKVREVVRENVGVWGSIRVRDQDVDAETGVTLLTVLEAAPSDAATRRNHHG